MKKIKKLETLKNGFKIVTDTIKYKDSHKIFPWEMGKEKFTFDTSISVGYGLNVNDQGISVLNESILEDEHNNITLGGAQYILSKIFGVEPAVKIAYLNDIYKIGTTGPEITEIYPKENVVCGFTLGVGGCGDAYYDIKTVLPQERALTDMIPFRITDQPLTGEEKQKYWLEKKNDYGKYEYYVKTFEATPKIRVLWDDAGKGQDGSPVTDNVHTSTRTDPIQTFVEILLRVDSADLREYFQLKQLEHGRFNEMGLVTGVKGVLEDGTEEYKQVLQFSILKFSHEMLHFDKDLSIIYRIYTS